MDNEISFVGGKFTRFKNKDFYEWGSVNKFPVQGIPFISIIELSNALRNSIELEFEEEIDSQVIIIFDYSEGDFTLSFYATQLSSKMNITCNVVFPRFQEGISWIKRNVKNPLPIFCNISNWDIL